MNALLGAYHSYQRIVLNAVWLATGVSYATIVGRCRQQPITDARHIAAWQLRLLGFSMNEVANALHRTRVTIINSLRQYARLYDADPSFRAKADKVSRYVEFFTQTSDEEE